MLSRRAFLRGVGGLMLAGAALGGYAFGVEPFRLNVTRYRLTPPRWPADLRLRIAVIADLHAGAPWMTVERIRSIVDQTNALAPDLTVLLGDYIATHRFVTKRIPEADWARALAGLRAPLGVHAVLGNHDWWDDRAAQARGSGPVAGRVALEAEGIAVYENDVVKLRHAGQGFWLAGLGDQIAFPLGGGRFRGVDDLPGTLAKLTDDAPAILLAHEPDIFPQVPERVSLALSGHTHGGQVRLFGYAPLTPSRFGDRYAYGHVVESDRHLIVSGGLGCSVLPMRLGSPPEIVLVELGEA